ncbi:DUF5959 family protein [Streptomyces sp. NPDC057939]|uniref:DUF5959 family protein n=1 Tax=Streptomyces sp. NPDC057939 TaxID=3346284 RepID=UPI0036E1DF09
MDDWSAALDELAAGRGIRWLLNTEIRIEIDRRFSVPVPVITVKDDIESIASVRVRLDVGLGWVDDLRMRYEHVRRTWPNEKGTLPRSGNFSQ